LNTIGFNDTNLTLNDTEIAVELFKLMIGEVSKLCGGIHAILFV